MRHWITSFVNRLKKSNGTSAVTFLPERQQIPDPGTDTVVPTSNPVPDSIFYLVYTSRATHRFTDDDLNGIIRTSQINNARHHLTGLLLYQDGRFMQLLEGDAFEVTRAYYKIMIDPRDQNVRKLIQGNKASRDFAAWSMALRDLDHLDARLDPDVKALLDSATLDSASFVEQPSRSLWLIRQFKDSHSLFDE